jgi:hypothetical protein
MTTDLPSTSDSPSVRQSDILPPSVRQPDISHYYTFRLDVYEGLTTDLVESFLQKEQFPKYLIYKEVSSITEKLHYQGFVEVLDNSEKAIKNLRSRLTSFFKTSKDAYSFAKVKFETYTVYITKDGQRELCYGISDNEVKDLESRSYKKPKPQSKQSYVEKYIEYMYEKFSTYDTTRIKTQKYTDDYGEELVDILDFRIEYDKFRRAVIQETIKYIAKCPRVFDNKIVSQFVNCFVNYMLVDNKAYQKYVEDSIMAHLN